MAQLYFVIMDNSSGQHQGLFGGQREHPEFYTSSKSKVAEALSGGENKLKARVFLFPQLTEITSAEINLA
jgi:hypothetical protein